MNSPFPDDLINAPNEDIPEAIPGLIHAARGGLRRGSGYFAAPSFARLRSPGVQGAGPAEGAGKSRGLLSWGLNCVVDTIETHLASAYGSWNAGRVARNGSFWSGHGLLGAP
jgi:hypothetical protein